MWWTALLLGAAAAEPILQIERSMVLNDAAWDHHPDASGKTWQASHGLHVAVPGADETAEWTHSHSVLSCTATEGGVRVALELDASVNPTTLPDTLTCERPGAQVRLYLHRMYVAPMTPYTVRAADPDAPLHAVRVHPTPHRHAEPTVPYVVGLGRLNGARLGRYPAQPDDQGPPHAIVCEVSQGLRYPVKDGRKRIDPRSEHPSVHLILPPGLDLSASRTATCLLPRVGQPDHRLRLDLGPAVTAM